MKKLFLTSLIALAGLFATSCVQEHLEVIYDPANVTAQTLSEIAGCALAEDGTPITATYNEADFNVQVPVSYTLLANVAGAGFDSAKKVDATIADGKISIEQPKLNKLLGNLGATPGTEFAVDFRLDAFLMNEKGAVENTRQSSNVVTAVFTPYETEKVLDVCDVPGDYQGWAPADYPKLFNYSGDGTIYRGVIDFKCTKEDGTAATGFKVTYGGNWDDDSGNWGVGTAPAAEADAVQLANGSGDNIMCYGEKRYYLFSFNKESLLLTKIMSFDKVGVIGLNGDWDNDIEMTYNMYKGRFWADVDAASATEFKFRLDGAWDNNWGGNLDGLEGGGANIAIEAGQYRIYFYMNDEVLTAEIDATMYGQEEPTIDQPDEPDEPVTYQGWGLIGVGGDWEKDIEMTENGGIWTAYATLTAADEWKFRKDAAWDENFGGTFTKLGEPFAAVAGGDNIKVGADGFFKIELNTNDNTITVSDGEVWSLIGDFNGWGGDVDMTLVDGKWVSPATALTPGWKIRHNHDWTLSVGGTFEALDTPFTAVSDNGPNIDSGTGEFIVTYDPEAGTITVSASFPENIWSVVGSFAANNWGDNDVKMTLQDGAYRMWISEPFEMKAGDEFKIRFNHSWDVNRGAECGTLEYDMSADAVAGGGNIKAPADGVYTVVYSETAELIFFKGWSVIGEVGGSNWDKDFVMVPMYDPQDGCYGWVSDAFAYEEGKGFKIRYQGSWDVNRGGTFSDWCVPFPVVQEGANIAAGACSNIFVAYSVLDDSISVGRADWGIIGDFNSWSGDVPMLETEPGIYDGALTLTEAGGIKIRKDRAWIDGQDRGGTFSALNTPFEAVPGGANIALEAGSYTIEYDSVNETFCIYDNAEEETE